METNLSPKQMQILEWIEAFLQQNHTMPSRREIGLGLGLSSPATIQQHIEALEKKGYLKRGDARESRALQWTNKSKKLFAHLQSQSGSSIRDAAIIPLSSRSRAIDAESESPFDSVPLLGTIAAGYPIEVFTDAKTVSIPLDLFIPKQKLHSQNKADDIYMLQVRGDSMIDDGIFQDDLVILKKSSSARPGDTVAALVNGEATLKRFMRAKAGASSAVCELHPANPNYPVISVGPDDRFEIQGILIGVIRKCHSPSLS